MEYVSASGEVMAVVFDADAMNAEVHMPDGRVFHLRHIPTENDTWYGADGVELILTGSNAYVKVDGRGVGAFSR